MPPGCGGAIVVMALYARGAVSYGAAIAALVATMGDATWVLLACRPRADAGKVLLLVTGTVTGYAVDAFGIAPRLRIDRFGVDTAPSGDVTGPRTGAAVAARVEAGVPGDRWARRATAVP